MLYVAPLLILFLVLAVPLAYRHYWPVRVRRPRLFLGLTLPLALAVAAAAIYWFFAVFAGVGLAGARARTPEAEAALATVLRNRLLVAAVCAVVVEYLLCRITQTLMGATAEDRAGRPPPAV